MRCDRCRSRADRLRFCGDWGWCCVGCVEHPENGALWRLWKALATEHERERRMQRQAWEDRREWQQSFFTRS
jgi:hypothetical protein